MTNTLTDANFLLNIKISRLPGNSAAGFSKELPQNKSMKIKMMLVCVAALAFSISTNAQTRKPSVSSQPFIVKTKQQINEVEKALENQTGNKAQDILAPAGLQTRIAVFHDEKRVDDMIELHD